ncbi:MAG: agmatinase [Chloroflexi bacterium]|nr:agmatinase [Chloroflexota bacterium]
MPKSKYFQPVDPKIYPRFEGIRTFMRLPFQTDLAEVDFAIVGVPFDTGATYRVGARFGPHGIRSESMLLRPFNPDLDIGIFEHCAGVDYGDIPVTPGYLPESHAQIEQAATKIFAEKVTPVFLGGDHSISLPLLRALHAVYDRVALIHFDSHTDVHPGYFGSNKDMHGTPFRRAVEEKLIDVSRSIQIGLRGSTYDATGRRESTDLGFQIITAPELHDIGVRAALDVIRQRVGAGPAYLSFDIDFCDPAFAPGTGTPEIGGFSSAQSQQLVRGLAGIHFIGFDLVEVIPAYDSAGITCLLAANLVHEFLSLIALQHARVP